MKVLTRYLRFLTTKVFHSLGAWIMGNGKLLIAQQSNKIKWWAADHDVPSTICGHKKHDQNRARKLRTTPPNWDWVWNTIKWAKNVRPILVTVWCVSYSVSILRSRKLFWQDMSYSSSNVIVLSEETILGNKNCGSHFWIKPQDLTPIILNNYLTGF